MHLQINMTYILIGTILIILGLLVQRFLNRRSVAPVTAAASKPMQIGFDMRSRSTTDVDSGPTPDTGEKPSNARISLVSRFSGLLKKPPSSTVKDEHVVDDKRPLTQAAELRTSQEFLAKVESRVNNVPRRKSPLRFVPKRDVDESTHESIPITHVPDNLTRNDNDDHVQANNPLELRESSTHDDDEEEILSHPRPHAVEPELDEFDTALPDDPVPPINDLIIPTADDDDVVQHVPTYTTATARSSPDEDDDDTPIDFFGGQSLGVDERQRLLEEMEQELARGDEDDEETEHTGTAYASESNPNDDTEEAAVVQEQIQTSYPGAMIETFRWTTFMGNDAQALGSAERANLIRLLRDMHDIGTCLPILMDAFNEETAENLRPAVLEAIIHSYNGNNLLQLYEYCSEHGSASEKTMAVAALQSIT